MSRDLDGTTDYLTTSALPISAYPVSVHFWGYFDTLTSGDTFFWLGDNGVDNQYMRAEFGGSSKLRAASAAGATAATAASTTALATGGWRSCFCLWLSSGSRSAGINGETWVTNTSSRAFPTNSDQIAIGMHRGSTPAGDADGRIAEVAVWNVALTQAENAALAGGVSPYLIRPGNLVCYWPLWGNASPEPDYNSGGATRYPLTVNGTAAQSRNPPTSPMFFDFDDTVAVLSGTAYTLDCQPGSFTITGTAAGVVAGAAVDAAPGAYTVTGVASTLSRGVTLNAEPGVFLIEDAETVGGGGPPEIDQNLGTVTDTDVLTTAEAVTAGARVFIMGHWYGTGAATGSVDDNGEGLTWSVEQSAPGPGDHRMAIWWADAPDGLPDATPLEPAFASAPVFGPGFAGVSFLNVGDLEDSAALNDFANPHTSGDVTVAGDEGLIIGLLKSVGNAPTAHTASGIGTEIHDWNTEGGSRAATQWAYVEAPDDYALTGSWDDPFFQASLVLAFEVDGGGTPSTGATLSYAGNFNAQPGSYTITGIPATIGLEIFLNAEPGSFAITGVATGLATVAQINAAPGGFTVTGVAAATMRSTDLDAQPGSFTVTGSAATLPLVAQLDAQPGSYGITGAAAGLLNVAQLNAQPGVYVITGVDATLEYVPNVVGTAYTLDAQPGSFAITGVSATLAAAASVDAQPGSFLVSGAAAALLTAGTVNASPGAFTVTGASAGLLGVFTFDAQPGAFTISGFDAQLQSAGMPQLPLEGDIVMVSATGAVRVIAAESQIIMVRLEGDTNEINAEGDIVVITPEGDIWRL